MEPLLRPLIYVIVLLFLSACSSSTWKFQNISPDGKHKTSDNEMVVIKGVEGTVFKPWRNSTKIRMFQHIDLNISKVENIIGTDYAYVTHLETPPGKIRVGVPTDRNVLYPSEVEFNALPGHKYVLTWVCIPYPYLAVVDEKSSKIVGIDSYCPGCNWIIGKKFTNNLECERSRPVWMKFSEPKLSWDPACTLEENREWCNWINYTSVQPYRNLCYAAEHNVKSAQEILYNSYWYGDNLIPRDAVLYHVWRIKAGDSRYQDPQALTFHNRKITPKELKQIHSLLKNWKVRDCEKNIFKSDYFRNMLKNLKDYKLMIGEQ